MVGVSKVTNSGNDIGFLLLTLDAGDFIGFDETGNTPEAAYYVLTGAPVDEGTWISFPAAYAGGVGVPDDGKRGTLSILLDPDNKLPPGGDLGDVLMKNGADNYNTVWSSLIDAGTF